MSIEVVSSLIEIIQKASNTLKKVAPEWSWKNHIETSANFIALIIIN